MTRLIGRPIRMGTLGAARITPNALLKPARQVEGIQVVAIAARDVDRARRFARKHAIPTVHSTYQELIDDPEIDAIYNPLPNSLHHPWTILALQSGKHVLCEKPFASNAVQAQEMKKVANETGLVLAEAFHNLYHPLTQQIKTVVDSGELGTIEHVAAHFNMPIPKFNDIRLEYELAGGAAMDVGCYPVGLLRYIVGAEPNVVDATAILASSQIDRQMIAQLRFPGGISGEISCALFLPWRMNVSMKVEGSRGWMQAINPWLPHYFNWLTIKTPNQRTHRRIQGKATYSYQLEAFVRAVRGEAPMFTDSGFGVRNMKVIDAIYQAAGLKIR